MKTLASLAGLALACMTLWVGPAAAQDRKPLKIVTIPFMDAGPLLLAQKTGIFEKHGLDVSVDVAASGATVVPTVLSGQYDVGYANAISGLQAIDNGLPLRFVKAAYHHPSDPEKDPYRVWVKPGGPITEPMQLLDANIGTLSVKNIAEWGTRKTLEKLGATNFDNMRWTRVTGEDAYEAVNNGSIDAVWLYEPLGAAARAAGLVPLLSTNSGSIPGAASGYYIASASFAEGSPELISAFRAAMSEANDYASEHLDEVRAAVVEKFNFDPELVAKAELNVYNNDPSLDSLDVIADDLQRYGLTKSKATVSQIYIPEN